MSKTKAASEQFVVEKLLYTKKEAAFSLGVGVRTIERMIANKDLPYRRSGKGGRVLIPAGDLRRVAKRETLQGNLQPELNKAL